MKIFGYHCAFFIPFNLTLYLYFEIHFNRHNVEWTNPKLIPQSVIVFRHKRLNSGDRIICNKSRLPSVNRNPRKIIQYKEKQPCNRTEDNSSSNKWDTCHKNQLHRDTDRRNSRILRRKKRKNMMWVYIWVSWRDINAIEHSGDNRAYAPPLSPFSDKFEWYFMENRWKKLTKC